MPRNPIIRRTVIFNGFRNRATLLANFAERVARAGMASRDYRELSALTCWISAIEAARRLGAISNASARSLQINTHLLRPYDFVPQSSYLITNLADWDRIAAGCFVAFIGAPYSAGQGDVLAHVMVSLGSGLVVGSNNGPINGTPAWTIFNLRGVIGWGDGRGYVNNRSFQIRVRDIEDQRAPDCFIQ
jgi:hypothetical protein